MAWLLIIFLQAPGGGAVTAIPAGRMFAPEGCEFAGAAMAAALETETGLRASWSCTAEVAA